MRISYKEVNFHRKSLVLIAEVNQIIEEYQSKGYSLTLRQVYYQLVARNTIPNNERTYKNLGNLISDGRLAGLISWDAIEDRTRRLLKNNHWESPGEIIEAVAEQFAFNKWDGQENYVEVWVEKDALVGIVGQICNRLDVPYFSCRGYVSQSEMWNAAQRLSRNIRQHKDVVIIHLGDHDPSGIDMSRDIVERLELFDVYPEFKRIALNINQVEEYQPPPNPTKVTDSRAKGYIERYGYECWELDALRPEIMEKLIRDAVTEFCDLDLFRESLERENEVKSILKRLSDDWPAVESKYK